LHNNIFNSKLKRQKYLTCLSRKPEALHTFDFFRVSLHAGAADSSIFPQVMVRRVLIMLPIISVLLACVAGFFRSRASLHLEHLALRHQLAVYQHTMPRPRLHPTDRLLWAWLSRLWSGWQRALVFVQPHTVIAWRRRRFRDHWRQLSLPGRPGRPTLAKEIRELIQAMWQSNPTWGSPRIVGELQKLGIDLAKSTVEKYRPRARKLSSPTWKAFLKNHVKDLVAIDFFVVPTVTYKVLFVLVILAHERRRVVHVNMTEHPTAEWTAQQVINAFPWDKAPRYLLRDRDCVYGASLRQRVRHMGIEEVVIAPRSPWQNPYVERFIGSIRRDCLDHVIVLHECHLRRLLAGYFQYYHHWRTHRALEMDCPLPRPVQRLPRPVQRPEVGPIREVPEVGGLHHHYERRAA
jgi:putative transposase